MRLGQVGLALMVSSCVAPPALAADPPAAPPLVVARELDPHNAPLPEGFQLVAREECGRPGSEPHRLRGNDQTLKADPAAPAGASPYRTCNDASNWDRAVVYEFDGLTPAARYRLRVGLPPQRGVFNIVANRLLLQVLKAPTQRQRELSAWVTAKEARLLEFDLPAELLAAGKLELRVGNREGWPAMVALLELWADRAVQPPQPPVPPPPATYAELAASAWNPVPVDGRRFFFPSYDDLAKHRAGGKYARFAAEAKRQGLLDPVWEWPNFFLADTARQAGVYEWGYHHPVDGETRFDCYQSRRQFFLQHLVPAKAAGKTFTSLTGHGWLEPYAAEWGADMLMTEFGAGSPCVQARMALLRGAGRQWRVPYCSDNSPWYGAITFYEAGEGEDVPRGGHSSWFQARMWYLSWLGGSLFALPEACQLTFFHRPPELRGKDFTAGFAMPKDAPAERYFQLSPTGARAKEFLAVTHRLPDVGIPYAPVALVLDHYAGFQVVPGAGRIYPWWRLEPTPGDLEIGRFLDEAYPRSVLFGPADQLKEPRMLVNSPYGDSFDLLLSTVRPELLRLYPVTVLLGDHQLEPAFRNCLLDYLKGGGHLMLNQRLAGQLGADLEAFRQAGRITVEEFTRDPAATRELLERLTRLYLPVEVKGDIEYTLNRTPTGWLVGLLENKGAWKEPVGPVVFDAAMSPTVTLRPRHGRLVAAREWVEDREVAVADNKVAARVPPGCVRVVELKVD